MSFERQNWKGYCQSSVHSGYAERPALSHMHASEHRCENNTVKLKTTGRELKKEKHNLGSYTGLDIKSPAVLFPLAETHSQEAKVKIILVLPDPLCLIPLLSVKTNGMNF